MRSITLSQAVNEAIAEEMRRDETVFLIGEDVAEAGTPFKAVSYTHLTLPTTSRV